MPDNLAFYLKYRPQSLDELVGQEVVKKNLLSAFQNNKLSHAYLFVGPRGTGKTSTSRILAKMVNCEQSSVVSLSETEKQTTDKPESENRQQKTDNREVPCNHCPTCLSITDGSNLDLIEIDAASNRGIEDIRSLRDKIKLAPTSARKKVYIIDEVHMLTAEAFNALLKTLEEPPRHALFILATTEVNKVPSTILSRVQKLDFKLATSAELLEALKRIIKNEKIDIDEEAVKALVKKADGSFRDGVKLLDQVSKGEKITAKLIDEIFKSSRFDSILDLIQSIKDKNASAGLLNISQQTENGVDVKELMLSLLDIFRSLVFIKNGLGEQLVKSHLTEGQYQDLINTAEDFDIDDLIKALDVLQNSLEKMKFTTIPSLPLELAIVEICSSTTVIARSETTKQSSSDQSRIQIATPRQGGARNDEVTPVLSENIPTGSIIEEAHYDEPIATSSPDILKLKEKWTFVLETIRPLNFSLEALLRSINVSDCTESAVIMEVPYSFHQRILEAPKNRDLLESILSDILGRSIRISIILGSRPARKDDIANIEVAEDDEIIRVAAEIFNSDTVN